MVDKKGHLFCLTVDRTSMCLKTIEEDKGMRIRTPLLALMIASLLSGCQNLDNNTLMQSWVQAFQAATLSDAQVKTLS